MKIVKKIIHSLLFLLSLYIVGTIVGGSVFLLRILGRIKITHWKRFPKYSRNPELFRKGLIVVSNHPSLLEPLLVAGLFFTQYFVHPFKLSPWNIPDEKNYNNIWWRWAKARIIWVDRENSEKTRRTFTKVKNVVDSGGIVILFPEGGRTFKRKKLYSQKGKMVAILQEGIGLLIRKTNAPILFIWVEGSDNFFPNTLWVNGQTSKFPFPRFWKKITIKIGNTIHFDKKSKEEITQEVAAKLLELADEE
jgi:1-acyl-sn-glycerol-3-phosphate acyltransferase